MLYVKSLFYLISQLESLNYLSSPSMRCQLSDKTLSCNLERRSSNSLGDSCKIAISVTLINNNFYFNDIKNI